ncbi:MAG: hypothetical protein ACREN6_03665 [Gemmatimonadaceae bacterium]
MRERAPVYLALACVLALASYHASHTLFAGWNVPADDGVLAQSAERVLRGELPHRDFDALWSGGLDWLNAGAFRVLGVRLSSLRIVLFVAWLAGLVAMFDAARGFLPVWGAALVTWCASLWTLPLAPSPLPSWYNLFLALIASAAVLRAIRGHTRRHTRRWMLAAGLAAGASIAVKIVGLYLVAAVFLFCVFEAQARTPAPDASRPRASRWYAWLITVGLAAFLGEVLSLIAYDPRVNTLSQFFFPSLAMVIVLLWREWKSDGSTDTQRLRNLTALVLPFIAGAAVVIAVWVAPYVASGSMAALWRGLFVRPLLRFDQVTYPLPGLRSAGLSVLPFAILLAAAPFVRRPLRRGDRWALAASVGLFIAMDYNGSSTVLTTWYAFRALTPCVALLTVWWFVRPPHGAAIPPGRQSAVFFLVSAAAVCSLVQVPMSFVGYFLYFVPLLMLGAAALWCALPSMPREIPVAFAVMAIVFQLRGSSEFPARALRTGDVMVPLGMPRGGILATRDDSAHYAGIRAEVLKRATSEWLFVWHDAPEIYFLTGMRNPTRTLFEAFSDPAGQTTGAVERLLREKNVGVVVLTRRETAERPMPLALRQWIEREYPSVAWVGATEVRGKAIVR